MHELAHPLFYRLCIVLLYVKETLWVEERVAYERDKQERCGKAKSGRERICATRVLDSFRYALAGQVRGT